MSPSESLTRWYLTDKGRYLLDRRRDLLDELTKSWSPRDARLLQVGCGDGSMLYRLWEAGHTVTCIDESPDRIASAERLLSGRGELMRGKADSLPFDDDEFDYVVIPFDFEFLPNPDATLREALRVSSRRVAFLFPSRLSLLPLYAEAIRYPVECRVFIPPLKARLLATNLAGTSRILLRTMLPTPPSLWTPSLARLNASPLPLPLGAVAGIVIEKGPGIPVTPLFISAGRPATIPDAARS